MLVSNITSPGTTGTEEPPGITAFSRRPFHTPPARANSSRNEAPKGISKLPGRSTWPLTEKHLRPLLFLTPSLANHCAPLRMMAGTAAKLSVLFTVVGRPYKPRCAGNGGLKRGLPGLPSRDSSRAVSSPQM